jgi:hypothetical protein
MYKGQNSGIDRRRFLQFTAGAAAMMTGVRHPAAEVRGTDADAERRRAVHEFLGPQYRRPRGCIYIPSRAWNDYQTWRDYDPQQARRDAGYARKLGVNAFRVWLSYEYWLHDAAGLHSHFNDFLSTCSAAGIRVMPDLFESDGVEPTPANLMDTNPWTASDVKSPATSIVRNRSRWTRPLEYVEWFMHHFGSDRRLLAIEVDNEPWAPYRMIFAREVMRVARAVHGKVPLTVGGSRTRQCLYFLNLGLDILQTHCNFPATIKELQSRIERQITIPEKVLDMPVWMTEWQRLRPHGNGWGPGGLPGRSWEPDYRSMAPWVHRAQIGNFFWSLMVKPAWLLVQRHKGTISGVFHEDGSVWSLADARAISQNRHFIASERKAWPSWADEIPKRLRLPTVIR